MNSAESDGIIKSEIGRRNGKKYLLYLSRLCDQFLYMDKQIKAKYWFLEVEDEYQGCYKLKREAYTEMDAK